MVAPSSSHDYEGHSQHPPRGLSGDMFSSHCRQQPLEAQKTLAQAFNSCGSWVPQDLFLP